MWGINEILAVKLYRMCWVNEMQTLMILHLYINVIRHNALISEVY